MCMCLLCGTYRVLLVYFALPIAANPWSPISSVFWPVSSVFIGTKSCQDFLHPTSRCRVVKVAAENHYLTLLGHLARILEVRILAADKRLKITFLCFKMQTYNERAKPLSLGCCDACFAIWNCITSWMQTRSSAVGSKLMVVGSTNGSSLNE